MPVLPTPDLLDSAEARPNNRCVHGLCRIGLNGAVLVLDRSGTLADGFLWRYHPIEVMTTRCAALGCEWD